MKKIQVRSVSPAKLSLGCLRISALIMLFAPQTHASQEIVYYHNDALGSAVAATDGTGKVLWIEEYEPYGTRILKQDNGKNDLWFTGKPEEPDFNLDYFGARWYDSTLGVFTSIDPIGFQEANVKSFNRYVYANANPMRFIDTSGLWPTGTLTAEEVHQNSVERVLRGVAPDDDVDTLKSLQKVADEDQSAEGSYKHAMSDALHNQSSSDAERDANWFVYSSLQAAIEHEKNGLHQLALIELGGAMHTLQDSTSPAHAGFQGWLGPAGSSVEAFFGGLSHSFEEGPWKSDPGPRSALDAATWAAWSYFKGYQPLPNPLAPNFFTFGSDGLKH